MKAEAVRCVDSSRAMQVPCNRRHHALCAAMVGEGGAGEAALGKMKAEAERYVVLKGATQASSRGRKGIGP